MRLLKIALLSVLSAVSLSAQVPTPQLNLSGNVGTIGFPVLNSGTFPIPTDADYTLSGSSANTSCVSCKITSTVSLTATRKVTYPAGRFFLNIENATTGGQSITIAGPSGAGVTIPNGQTISVWNDGAGFVQIGAPSAGSPTFATLTGGVNTGNSLQVGSGSALRPMAAGVVQATNVGNAGWQFYPSGSGSSSNLADWTQVGSQFSSVNGQIVLSGTTGDFSNYITLNGSNNNDQTVDFKVRFLVNASQPGGGFCGTGTNYGIAIGKLGTSQFSTNTLQAFLATAESPVDALKLFYNGSQIPGTTTVANPTCIAAGDTVELVYSQRGNVITLIYNNITQGTHNSTTYTDPLTATTHYAPNSSKFAIWSVGGAFTILDVKVTSRQPPNPRVAFLGDSKTYGFNGGARDQRFSDLLKQYGPVANYAGQGDVTGDLLADLPYILRSPPAYAVLCIGYNDKGYAVATATWQAHYAATVAALQAAGTTVVNMLSIPANAGVDVTDLNAYINANDTNVVDPGVGWSNSLYLSSDNVHPNAAGMAFVAGRIASYGYIPLPAQAPQDVTPLASILQYPPANFPTGTSGGGCTTHCTFAGTTTINATSSDNPGLLINTTNNNAGLAVLAPVSAGGYVLNEIGVSNTAHNVFYQYWKATANPFAMLCDTYSSGDPCVMAGSQQWLSGPVYVGNSNANGGATLPSGCTGLSIGASNQTCFPLAGGMNASGNFPINVPGTNHVEVDVNGTPAVYLNDSGVGLTGNGVYGWTGDTGFSRVTPGTVALGNGTVGSSTGTLMLTSVLGQDAAPSGGCSTSGAVQITKDGQITGCKAGTWTPLLMRTTYSISLTPIAANACATTAFSEVPFAGANSAYTASWVGSLSAINSTAGLTLTPGYNTDGAQVQLLVCNHTSSTWTDPGGLTITIGAF